MRMPLVVTVLGLSLCAQVFGADFYVRAGAEGTGTKAAPYGFLWKALGKAVRGDVIHVAEGTYNGKGGSGHFVVTVPHLTLAGGYSADFSERNPFKHLTVLERAADFKGDWTGLPGGIIAGKGEHAGLTVDGFVLNAQSRNTYKPNGDINIDDSYKGVGVEASKDNIKVRNCVILNPLGDGIYCAWSGKDNEIANCFVVNTFYNAIATRSAQPESEVRIKNCTVAFCWYYPSRGGAMSVFVGRQGKTIMENNVFMCNQTEGDEAGYGVSNTFGNDATELKGNLFFQCQGGYYKYMDQNKQSLIVWKPSELKDLNQDPGSYVLEAASGNTDEDPKMAPDKAFFEKFSNFVASKPGKLNMDAMNEWRRSVGLNLQAEPGSPRKNYGMAYPLSAVVPGLVSKVAGKGVQLDGPFQSYTGGAAAATAVTPAKATNAEPKSAAGDVPPAASQPAESAPAAAKQYASVAFASFKKGAEGLEALNGKAVQCKVSLGGGDFKFLLKTAPREEYDCVKLLAPGVDEPTRDHAFGYLLKGSAAQQAWKKFAAKKDRYKAGVTVKGAAFHLGENYPFPVGIVIDEVSAE